MNGFQQWLWRRVKRIAGLLPIAALLFIYVTILLASIAVFDDNKMPSHLDTPEQLFWGPNEPGVEAARIFRDVGARLTWTVLLLVQTLAFLGAILVFSWVLILNTPFAHPRLLLGVLVTFLLGVAISLEILNAYHLLPDLGRGSGLVYIKHFYDLFLDRFGSRWIRWLVSVENSLVLLVICLGTFASAATVTDPRGGHSPESIRTRLNQLRNLLTVSAVILVIGVVQINAQFRWAAAVVEAKIPSSVGGQPTIPLAESVAAYASAVALTVGGIFTLFLLAVFGTAFFVLDRKAEDLALTTLSRSPDVMAPHEWRDQRGLVMPLSQIYVDLSKILGPLIAAILGGFVRF